MNLKHLNKMKKGISKQTKWSTKELANNTLANDEKKRRTERQKKASANKQKKKTSVEDDELKWWKKPLNKKKSISKHKTVSTNLKRLENVTVKGDTTKLKKKNQ